MMIEDAVKVVILAGGYGTRLRVSLFHHRSVSMGQSMICSAHDFGACHYDLSCAGLGMIALATSSKPVLRETA